LYGRGVDQGGKSFGTTPPTRKIGGNTKCAVGVKGEHIPQKNWEGEKTAKRSSSPPRGKWGKKGV